MRCGIRDNGGLGLVIMDTGIGIPAEDIPKVLERFGQVRDGHMHTHEGTGLGLALTKLLMELHGGTLEIESKVGKGTVVIVAFPPERTGSRASTQLRTSDLRS